MPVCQFFLQGRCRYGEKCWNEHSRGGGGGGGRGGGGGGYSNNRAPPPQQQPRGGGGGGFGNRVWVNPSQQRGGYVQPSSFGSRENDQWNRRGDGGGGGSDWGRGGGGGGGSGGSDWGRGGGGGSGGSDWGRGGGGGSDWGRGGGGGSDWGRGGGGGSDWGRGGGGSSGSDWGRSGGGGSGSDWGRGGEAGGGGFGRRENIKSSEFNFSQNRFSALDTPSTFDKGGRTATTGDEENDRKCETIQSDMEAWENSGQWGFSTYSHAKNPLSGFSDLSPEELRLEYYTSRASGNLQNYINGINQLLSQWRSRVQELKLMNASTRAALIRELNSSATQESSKGFGSTDTGSAFGSKGFGASDELSSFNFAAQTTGFGSPSVSTSTGFGGAPSAPPPSGFGATSAPSASAFSFAASDKTSTITPSGFGSASGFSFSSGTGGGFGSGFGAQTPATTGATSVFVQPSTSVPALTVPAGGASDCLFSNESNLTSEELDQFKAKRFTLGQIPLKPPPANLLSV